MLRAAFATVILSAAPAAAAESWRCAWPSATQTYSLEGSVAHISGREGKYTIAGNTGDLLVLYGVNWSKRPREIFYISISKKTNAGMLWADAFVPASPDLVVAPIRAIAGRCERAD